MKKFLTILFCFISITVSSQNYILASMEEVVSNIDGEIVSMTSEDNIFSIKYKVDNYYYNYCLYIFFGDTCISTVYYIKKGMEKEYENRIKTKCVRYMDGYVCPSSPHTFIKFYYKEDKRLIVILTPKI